MCLSQFVPGTVQENGREKKKTKKTMGNGLVTEWNRRFPLLEKGEPVWVFFVFLFWVFFCVPFLFVWVRLVFFPRQSNSSELLFCVILCVHSHVRGARIKCQLQA